MNDTTREGPTMNDITPQQAREQLAHAEAATGRRDAERRVHALATAAFGLLIGVFLAVSRISEDTRYESVVIAFYALALVALTTWQTRGARAWPRHARRTSWVGLGTTMVLFLAAVMVFNVREMQQERAGLPQTENIGLLVLAGLLVAAPMVLAGLRIRRGDQR
ncbi:hypothetical protein [Arthrobacter sp. NEB 688]|uniref:hypothetical protein n=1 Tax=Arthrobacter sp. NEB 688 TaxID=904039 RepID=UPI0015634880|nr:hypothetical protein [Arthrobacter sp. NEB 688]QKE85572.1 hypothetical protein HL663_17680 [Arthrobacter sp. NEB 688]